jgi:nitronate monooxygenase
MYLHTPVCDLLGCEVPIVLAGMGGVARSELVTAVSEAGGFGFLGMVRESPDFIRAQIDEVRAKTARPFGVNLIPAATKAPLLEAELAACLEAKVHAVTLFWDLSAPTVQVLKNAGVLVVCQVGSVAEALAAQDAGADILIAQGWEAGGHVRGRTGLSVLLSDVVAAVEAPVLAAGGIVDGEGVARAMRQGAQGAVIGTAFLATEESFAHAYHKQRIVEAQPDDAIDTEIFHINWPAGATVRVLPNSVTRGERGDPFSEKRSPIGADGARSIYLFSTDSPLRSMSGDLEAMALYAGQGAGRIDAIPSAAVRLKTIAEAAAWALSGKAVSAPADAEPRGSPSDGADYASRDELVAELNTLLEAERAGARVGAGLVREARDPEMKALARVIHADEVRWCRALFAALVELEAEPSTVVGGFYEQATAIEQLEARVAFVNRGQGWVVRKLRGLLPRIRNGALHQTLTEMLTAHEVNIASANDELRRRAPQETA